MIALGILETIQNGIFWLLLKIDAIVYTFIDWIYQIILLLAKGNILQDNTIINEMINRLYVVVGVVVLFIVAYSLLRNMANPDEALKGKESPVKLISNVVISIVLIALIPSIFTFAMNFQNALLTQNTIGKIILGENYTHTDENGNPVVIESSENIIAAGGFEIASTVFQAFFQPNTMKEAENGSGNGYCTGKQSIDTENCIHLEVDGKDYSDWWEENVNKPKNFFAVSELSDLVVEDKINYTFLISTAAGIFVIFVLLSYAIDIAIRLVKLAIYQLIAPLPILARIVPKEDIKKVFSNWLKATISTYVEVFVRLAILFFCVLIIKIVTDNFGNIISIAKENWGAVNPIILLLAQALVIVGIIAFVKQAPGIIKDITGLDGGKYGKSLMRGIGMMGASLGGGATAAIRSAAGDHEKYGWNKSRGIKENLINKGKQGLRAGTAALGGINKGIWNGRKVEKFGDIPKTAGKTSSDILNKRADIEAARGYRAYYKNAINDKINDVEGWVTGSFEAKQKVLDEVNSFLKDAKAVKSTTEGLVRDKKYMFSMVGKGETPKVHQTSDGENIIIDENTSLSAVDSIIQSLKSTGKVEDAKLADQLNNEMQQRIKKIGQEMVAVSVDNSKAADFDDKYMMSTSKGIIGEALPTLSTTESQFKVINKRYKENSSLDAVKKFIDVTTERDNAGNVTKEGGLYTDNVSKLADQLEIQAAEIQQEIKLEQERRKTKEKK